MIFWMLHSFSGAAVVEFYISNVCWPSMSVLDKWDSFQSVSCVLCKSDETEIPFSYYLSNISTLTSKMWFWRTDFLISWLFSFWQSRHLDEQQAKENSKVFLIFGSLKISEPFHLYSNRNKLCFDRKRNWNQVKTTKCLRYSHLTLVEEWY